MSQPAIQQPNAQGYWTDALGRLVPDATVSEIDKLREQTVMNLVTEGLELNERLAAFKRKAFEDIAAFIEISAERFDVRVGGTKGNVRLTTYARDWKVERSIQEYLSFGEQLIAAKALIDECITEWAQGSRAELNALVNSAFQVDREGRISTNRVLSLKRIDIKDPKWQRAMAAIHESIQITGTRSYIRIYRRKGDAGDYEAVPLDISSV
jgi:hypothetical protein